MNYQTSTTDLRMRDSALFPATAMLVLCVCGVMLIVWLVAHATQRPAQIIADAFQTLSLAPAHGSLCMPMSFNVEDRRDAIAVLIENN